ncbi:hypothetical protein KM1_139040 [Entamoeba histolytica HM-3:IMSS]|uniref:tRNA-splicing endonuclease subunit Sen15 domain-containing protein n=1 Tax=Entamoeba histolytica HM-3:IMSS TaxID=885315 RepID=M7WZ42_ENTHI|nr:hypothetical protein KM1_139040 [Entamoeba histolytica HM-3:IMSS]
MTKIHYDNSPLTFGRQEACRQDLIRRGIYTGMETKNNINYFPTTEGNVVVIEREKEITLVELEQLSLTIPQCVLAIVSQDSSIVYYSISPISLTFKK